MLIFTVMFCKNGFLVARGGDFIPTYHYPNFKWGLPQIVKSLTGEIVGIDDVKLRRGLPKDSFI